MSGSAGSRTLGSRPPGSKSLLLGLVVLLHGLPVTLTFTLRVLHTNDVHGRFEQTNVHSGMCTQENAARGQCYGGYARFVSKVKELRSLDPNHTIVLDAGDQYTGTLWFHEYGGNLTAFAENLLHYDVSTLGNHDFDKGVTGLLPFLSQVDHPVVCANLDLHREPRLRPYVNSSVVLTRDGVKIGVIGYITTDTASISKDVGSLGFLDVVDTVRSEVQRLQGQGVDIIIGLSHAGLDKDRQVAKQVNGIDVIVGGHSHSFLWTGDPPSTESPVAPYPVVVENPSGHTTLVVQAYAYTKYLGDIQIQFDSQGNVANWTGSPILLNNAVPQDNATLRALAPWGRGVAKLRHTVLGSSHVFLQGHETHCRRQECGMGNVVADALLWWWQTGTVPTQDAWTNVSIAITNGGGVRTSLEQGNITEEDVINVLPFDNFLLTIDMKGRYVRQMFEQSASHLSADRSADLYGGFLQVSGVRVTYDVSRPPGQRLVELLLRCAHCTEPAYLPVEDAAVYRIAIPDFTANGGDGYDVIKNNIEPGSTFTSGKRMSSVLSEYVKNTRPLFTGIEGRINIRYANPCVTGAAWRLGATTPLLLVVAFFAIGLLW